jgi:hypothetical protein
VAVFKPGQSGNPAGKRPGTTSRLVREARRIASREGPEIVRSIAEKAKTEPFYASLFMRYLVPKSKIADEPTPFDLPEIASAADLPGAVKAILSQMANGDLTIADGSGIIAALEGFGRSLVLESHEARLQALEELLARHGVKPP